MALLVVMPQTRAGRKIATAPRASTVSRDTTEERWPMMTALIVWSLVSAVAWGGAIAAVVALL